MRLKGKFKSHWYLLPEGYDLKKAAINKKGFIGKDGYVVCNRKIKRYLWNPEKGDLFYEPTTRKMFKYMLWQAIAPSGLHSIDGFAKVREASKTKSFWVNNLTVRECIPIVRKEEK